MEGCQQSDRGSRSRRLAAALVVLAIGFLLLAPDPHDHGDAGSLGGLLRLFLPHSSRAADPHHSEDESQPEANGSCAIHFWHQVAATGVLIIFLLRFSLSSLFRLSSFVTAPCAIDLQSFHSRAPPVFP